MVHVDLHGAVFLHDARQNQQHKVGLQTHGSNSRVASSPVRAARRGYWELGRCITQHRFSSQPAGVGLDSRVVTCPQAIDTTAAPLDVIDLVLCAPITVGCPCGVLSVNRVWVFVQYRVQGLYLQCKEFSVNLTPMALGSDPKY